MLPKHPAIVGAVADAETLAELPNLADAVSACDYLEYRIDALLDDGVEPESIPQHLASSPRPALITVRDPAEGGRGGLAPEERAAWMEGLLPHATLVDVEIRNLASKAFEPVRREAPAHGVSLIGSFHDFAATPPGETLRDTIERGRDAGAGLIKMATCLRHGQDLHTLLRTFETESPRGPMTVMGMGPLGMGSRVLFAQTGSLLTYTFLKRANAPGQWAAPLMRQLFRELGLSAGEIVPTDPARLADEP